MPISALPWGTMLMHRKNKYDHGMRRLIPKQLPDLGRNAWRNLRVSTAQKLTVMLFLMFLAAGANIFLFKSFIHDFRDMAGTVSMAGKLRLLSQKIELDIVQFAGDPGGSPAAVLNGIAEFDAVLAVLT